MSATLRHTMNSLRTLAGLLVGSALCLLAACGGGGASEPAAPQANDIWKPVRDVMDAAAAQFPNGLTVEVATAQGVVFSRQLGAFSNDTFGEVASASKWVSATVFMRLIDQGVLSLDTKTKDVLTDLRGQPWSGNLGETTLRDLLSFQAGIPDENVAAVAASTLATAVNLIYAQDGPTAQPAGTYFSYANGSNSFRIAARMAEVRSGKTWAQLFNEQVRDPLGWSGNSAYRYTTTPDNPNPAGALMTTGREYMRLLVMLLNRGSLGNTRLLPAALVDEQRKDPWRPSTTILFSPYTALGKSYHYGLGQWRECDAPGNVAACDASLRVSSTGAFGFAPWIDVQRNYAGIVMTRQPGTVAQGVFRASDELKWQLATLIPAALAQNPPVIRAVP